MKKKNFHQVPVDIETQALLQALHDGRLFIQPASVSANDTRAHALIRKEVTMAEPRLIADLLSEYLCHSEESLAIGYPNTELSVDLKLLTQRPGRMEIGEMLTGALWRDNEDHFTFMQDASEKKNAPAPTRNPHVYEGHYINVNRRADGTLYPTFCRPPYSDNFTFRDFCRAAAEELLMVARTFDMSGLVEESKGK